MPVERAKKYRMTFACILLAGAVVATATAFARPSRHAPSQDAAGLYSHEAEGFRYEYHAPTGHEGLYDLRTGADGVTDVLPQNVEVAKRCRAALEQKLKVKNLDELRAEYDDTIRRLKALGYL
jgi:hypothetical protein